MKKRFTVFIYNNTGSLVKLKYFSKASVVCFSTLVIGSILIMGILGIDYFHLKNDMVLKKNNISVLNDVIEKRDIQLQQFKGRVEILEQKLIQLNQLEQQIRQIADIKENENILKAIGIGGSVSKTLGPNSDTTDIYDKRIRELFDKVDRLDRMAADQSENYTVIWETLHEIKKIQEITPSIRPVDGGWISSKFGYRDSPFTGKREFHSGVDIAIKTGTPVKATANGKVVYVGYKDLLGKAIVIEHGFGIRTQFGHLSAMHVKAEQEVKRGDIIGVVGSTGRSTGPHLHYEVSINNVPLDAQKYMAPYLASNIP